MFVRMLTILCLETFFHQIKISGVSHYLFMQLSSYSSIFLESQQFFPIVCNLWSFLVVMNALFRIKVTQIVIWRHLRIKKLNMGIICDLIGETVLRKGLRIKNALETACNWSIIFFSKSMHQQQNSCLQTFMQQVKVLLGSHYLSMQHYYYQRRFSESQPFLDLVCKLCSYWFKVLHNAPVKLFCPHPPWGSPGIRRKMFVINKGGALEVYIGRGKGKIK